MGPKQDRRTCKGVCFRPVRYHRYRSTKHNCQRQSCSGRSRRVTQRERPISEAPGSSQSGRGLQAPGNRSLHITPYPFIPIPSIDAAAGALASPGIHICRTSGLSRCGKASYDRRTGMAEFRRNDTCCLAHRCGATLEITFRESVTAYRRRFRECHHRRLPAETGASAH